MIQEATRCVQFFIDNIIKKIIVRCLLTTMILSMTTVDMMDDLALSMRVL